MVSVDVDEENHVGDARRDEGLIGGFDRLWHAIHS